MNDLTDIAKGYIAGLIDGEGSITIHQRRDYSKSGKKTYFRPLITIYNTNPKCLHKVKEFCDSGSVLLHNDREHHKTAYMWYCSEREELYSLLTQIRDILILKQPQADLLMKFLISRRDVIDDIRPTRFRPYGYTDYQLEIIREIREMNKRLPARVSGLAYISHGAPVNSLPSIA